MKLDLFWQQYGRTVRYAVALLLLFAVAGCSGITPEELRNTREEGPEKGLFSGPDGEFVLIGPATEVKQAEEDAQSKESP